MIHPDTEVTEVVRELQQIDYQVGVTHISTKAIAHNRSQSLKLCSHWLVDAGGG